VVARPGDTPRSEPKHLRAPEIEGQSGGGFHATIAYNVADVTTGGTLDVEIIDPYETIVYRFDIPGLTGTVVWYLTAENGTTEVIQNVDYGIDETALGSVPKPIAETYNERQFRTALANLKTYIEERGAAVATGGGRSSNAPDS